LVDCGVSTGFEALDAVGPDGVLAFPTGGAVSASEAFLPQPATSNDPAIIHNANLMESAFEYEEPATLKDHYYAVMKPLRKQKRPGGGASVSIFADPCYSVFLSH
jgi:hypothetical protein